MADELVVRGYRDFLKACDRADRDTKRMIRRELREAGNVVRDDSRRRMERFSPRSAAGYRTVIRQRGVAVEQSIRKTTGKHPEWGAFQMTHALIPARNEKEQQVEVAFDKATDRICDYFERGH